MCGGEHGAGLVRACRDPKSPGEGRSWGSACVPGLAPRVASCSSGESQPPQPPLDSRAMESAHCWGHSPASSPTQQLLHPRSLCLAAPSLLGITPNTGAVSRAVMGRGQALCPAPVPVLMALNCGAGLPGTVLPRGVCRGPGPSGSLLCFVPQRQWQFGINGVRTPWLAAAWKSFLLLSPLLFVCLSPSFLFLSFLWILNSCDLQGNHGASPPPPVFTVPLFLKPFSEQKLPLGLRSLCSSPDAVDTLVGPGFLYPL